MAAFNTYDYEFLLRSLSEGSVFFKAEASKRLITLASSDRKQFAVYSRAILTQIQTLYKEDKEELNVFATQLLSEIISQIMSKEYQQLIRRHLVHLIVNLGHPSKTNLRKASHGCLLNYLKAYHNFEALQEAYSVGLNHESALIQQKSINSFQSILILELKFYDFSSRMSRQIFELLVDRIDDQNAPVAKAATQCLISMFKMEGVNSLLKGISGDQANKLKSFLEELLVKNGSQSFVIEMEQINEAIQSGKKHSKVDRAPAQAKNPEEQEENLPKSVEAPKNPSNIRRLEKIKNALKNEERKTQEKEHHGKLFSLASNEGSLKERTENLEDLLYKIQVNRFKLEFDSSIKAIFPNLLRTLKESNPKLVSLALKILENIIEQVSSSEASLGILISAIVEKLGDPKISIRQNVGKVIRELIARTPRGMWVRELLENMRRNTNVVLKEESLNLLQYIYDTSKEDVGYPTHDILEQIVVYTDDPKTKIKIRTLDCLAAVVFKLPEREKHNFLLKTKMSSIFYQMYLQKIAKLQSDQERAAADQQKKKKIEDTQEEQYRSVAEEHSEADDESINVSMEVVKKRVSLLRKPRNLLSTQQTISVQNSTHRAIQDVEIVLPSLYKKTNTNRFIAKRPQFTPNKTIDSKPSDYLSKDDLKPLKEPEREMKNILAELKSLDWKVQFETINKLRRVIQFNPEVVLGAQTANIHALTIDVLAMIENLRSSVAKNALICLNEFMVVLGKQIDPEMEIILEKLIKKSADTNIFISSEVQRCLATLGVSASPLKLLEKLAVYRESKSIPVKDAVVTTLLGMKDCTKVFEKEYPKLAETIGYYLTEGQIEVRNKAKIGITELCRSLGDWYRALRGKINPNCFKSICELMTKSPNLKREDLFLMPSIRKEEMSPQKIMTQRPERPDGTAYNTVSCEQPRKERVPQSKAIDKISISEQRETIDMVPRKRLTKVSQFPDEFNDIQSSLDLSNSSDWKKRIECINKIKELALQFPNEFAQYRSATHFIDVICRQIQEPNVKVSINAMDVLTEIFEPLRSLVEGNLGVISNCVYNSLSSSKNQTREAAQKCLRLLLEEIDIQTTLQHLCQGILYSLPRSRILLLSKLGEKVEHIYDTKKQLLYKHIFPLLNKLMEEYKSELMPSVIGVFNRLYDAMGKEMYGHLTKFKQVRELIDR